MVKKRNRQTQNKIGYSVFCGLLFKNICWNFMFCLTHLHPLTTHTPKHIKKDGVLAKMSCKIAK